MSVFDQFPGGPVLVKERRQDKIQRVIMEAQMEAIALTYYNIEVALTGKDSSKERMKALAKRMADKVREIQEEKCADL